jgi:hypothetical protein
MALLSPFVKGFNTTIKIKMQVQVQMQMQMQMQMQIQTMSSQIPYIKENLT